MLQLGVGGQISLPMAEGRITSIPELHIMALVDAKGGVQTNFSQFVAGGPILTTKVQSGRLIGKIGASYSFLVGESLHVMANYDFEKRREYHSNEFNFNLRYVF